MGKTSEMACGYTYEKTHIKTIPLVIFG